jgi:hypothetical protein
MSSIPRVSSTASELNDFNESDGKKIYNVSKSRLESLINWVHVFGTYLSIVWFIVVGILLLQVFSLLYELRFNLKQFYFNEISVFPLERPIGNLILI